MSTYEAVAVPALALEVFLVVTQASPLPGSAEPRKFNIRIEDE